MGHHRAAQADIHAVWQRRRRGFQFLAQDEALGRRPVLAAPFDRPVRHGPALGVELPVPADDVFLVRHHAIDQLLLQLGWQVLLDPCAHFVAKRQFFGGEAHIHQRFSDFSLERGQAPRYVFWNSHAAVALPCTNAAHARALRRCDYTLPRQTTPQSASHSFFARPQGKYRSRGPARAHDKWRQGRTPPKAEHLRRLKDPRSTSRTLVVTICARRLRRD